MIIHRVSESVVLYCTVKQWRRQTIKSGSAFKGQLYVFPGRAEWRNRRSGAGAPREVGCGRSVVALPLGSLGYAPENFSKINFEIAYFPHLAN